MVAGILGTTGKSLFPLVSFFDQQTIEITWNGYAESTLLTITVSFTTTTNYVTINRLNFTINGLGTTDDNRLTEVTFEASIID